MSPIALPDAGRDAPALDVFDVSELDVPREDRSEVPPPLDTPALDRSAPFDRIVADTTLADAPVCPNGM